MVFANAPGTTAYFDRSVVTLVARRANVVLVIDYGGEQEPGPAEHAIVNAASETMARLHVW